MLDVGCGAGNYTLKLLEKLQGISRISLIDLSQPMLDRAVQRISAVTNADIEPAQGDVRDLDLGRETHDVIIAAAVLHHLRSDAEWETVFARFFAALRPGGSVWISDLVTQENAAVQRMMWRRYGEYLVSLKGAKYRDEVFAYVEKEDTPRPLVWQLELLRQCGFAHVEVLHKNACFAAFGAIKAG